MGCDINNSRRGFEYHKMSKRHKSGAGGKRAGHNATADPAISDHLKGCLSAAFSRAAEILRYKNWDGIRNSEDRTLTLRVRIDKNSWNRPCEWIEARGGSDEGAGKRLVIYSSNEPLNHPHLAEQLGGEGWKELEAAFVAQGDARISTVAIDKGCKFLVLTLCFMPLAKWEEVAHVAPRRAAGGRDVSHCGARHQTGAGGGPRRIGLQGFVDALTH